MVRDRRIVEANDVRLALSEQVNILRKLKPKDNKQVIDISRAITYALNTSLTAISQGEYEERLEALEEQLEMIDKY